MRDTSVAVALISLAAAIAGVVISKLWDTIRDRIRADATVKTAEIVDAAKVREELWAEIGRLRDRLEEVEVELHTARRQYLELLAEHTDLKEEHRQLKRAHDELQAKHEAQVEHLRTIPDEATAPTHPHREGATP